LVISCEITDTAEVIVPNPKLIIEILSPRTEARDRFEKRLAYQCLVRLHEYILVAQDRPHVEVFRRQPDGWEVETYGPHETVSFNTVNSSVAMDLIYEDIRDYTESSGE
jgi:Uma2 family endonuclease